MVGNITKADLDKIVKSMAESAKSMEKSAQENKESSARWKPMPRRITSCGS